MWANRHCEHSDGAGSAHYRHGARTVQRPPSAEGIRGQQRVEGMEPSILLSVAISADQIQIEKRMF